MKRKTKVIAVSMITVLLAVLLSGCGRANIRKDILGKWVITKYEWIGSNKSMMDSLQDMLMSTLFSEGSEIEFINKNKMSLMMNSVGYEWIDENKLEIGSDGTTGDAILFDVSMDHDSMFFENQYAKISLVKKGSD